jgi:general nucleoside transport system permease protein
LAIITPVALTQDDPLEVLRLFLFGPLSSIRAIGNVAEAATPILLTGAGAAIVFRSGQFNLGVEGSAFLGGLGAAATALVLQVPPILTPAIALAGGAIAGTLACWVPGEIRLRTGASEMVLSLLLNFVWLQIGLWVLNHYMRDPMAGALASYTFPPDATLERILRGTRLTVGIFIALGACILLGIWLYCTRGGLNLRIVGSSPGFGRHLGLGSDGIIRRAQILGGALAGLAGAVEILGLYTRFTWTTLPGLGWTGITAALLARDNPFLVIPAAFFLAYLQVGGNMLARGIDIPPQISG